MTELVADLITELRTDLMTDLMTELIIDFIDSKTKRLVWQGIGHGFIDIYMKDRDKQINNFVKQIIDKYPN